MSIAAKSGKALFWLAALFIQQAWAAPPDSNCNMVSGTPVAAGAIQECVDRNDSIAAIQRVVDYVRDHGGGLVKLAPQRYRLNKPLMLREGVSIKGDDGQALLEISGPEGIKQDPQEKLVNIDLSNLTLIAIGEDSKLALSLASHERCRFEKLSFEGFKSGTLIRIAPNWNKKPARNAVFNVYRDFYADVCDKCVVYDGKSYSLISNDIWENIVFSKVLSTAIEAQHSVDSEKWFGLYARAANDKVILINLNTSSEKWERVDRFHFYSPTLVYEPNPQHKSPIAIRFGKDTFRHFFWSVITDKKWDKFILDDGARSYYIVKDGNSFKEPPGLVSKGFDAGGAYNEKTAEPAPAGKQTIPLREADPEDY